MKGVISLGLVCLLACSVTSTGSHSRSSRVSLSRASDQRDESCELKCKPAPDSDENSQNWLVEIDANLYVIYNAGNNFLVVFNKSRGFSFFYLSGGFIAVVNHRDGGLIVANVKTDQAIFVSGSGRLSGDVLVAINAAFEVIVTNQAKLAGTNVNEKEGSFFRLSWLLEMEVHLNGRDFFPALKQSFGGFVEIIANSLVKIAREAPISCLVINVIVNGHKALSNVLNALVLVGSKVDGFVAKMLYSALMSVAKGVQALGMLAKSIAAVGSGLYSSVKEAYENLSDKVITSKSKLISYDGKNMTATITLKLDLSWSFEISSNRQLSNKVIVLYDVKSNLFIFRNYQTNMMLVFTGKNRKYGLFNTATGAAIIVEYKRGFLGREAGAATFVDKNEELAAALRENHVGTAYATISKIIKDTQVPKTADFNIISVIHGKTDGISGALLAKLEVNFGLLLKFHDTSKENQFALIVFMFGDLNVKIISNNFIMFQKAVFNVLQGYYNAPIMANCALGVNIFLESNFIGVMLEKVVTTISSYVVGIANQLLFSDKISYNEFETVSVEYYFFIVIHIESSATVKIDPAVSKKLAD